MGGGRLVVVRFRKASSVVSFRSRTTRACEEAGRVWARDNFKPSLYVRRHFSGVGSNAAYCRSVQASSRFL